MSKKEKIMRKTKIVCTIGPACDTVQNLRKLALSGMNVARINMSHGDELTFKTTIDNIKTVRNELGTAIAIMADTKGPEIRIKKFKNNFVILEKNQTFTLTTNEVIGNDSIVSLAYKNLVNQVKVGEKIYANNGMIVLKVKSVSKTEIECKVLFGGKLTSGKGLNIPNIVPKHEYLSDVDKKDLLFATKNGVDFVACSFVSKAQDLIELKQFLDKIGSRAKLIAKIENGAGIKNLKEILNACDGIMVARGDLGVEIPLESVPIFQKKATALCKQMGKVCIIATEMIESMTNSPRPTRAEVSDCANAIFEKSTATMLSGETAIGKYPFLTTKTMAKILNRTEKSINYKKDFLNLDTKYFCKNQKVCFDTCKTAKYLGAKLVVLKTKDGQNAILTSSLHPSNILFVITNDKTTYNQLSLYWGVIPYFAETDNLDTLGQNQLSSIVTKNNLANKNDMIVVQNDFENCTSFVL